MKNIVDLIHVECGIDRTTVETVVTAVMTKTKETLLQGNEVYWPGLCQFSWKKTAKGKKPKVVPENKDENGHVDGKGFEDISLDKDEFAEAKEE